MPFLSKDMVKNSYLQTTNLLIAFRKFLPLRYSMFHDMVLLGLTETCGPTTIGFPDEMCMLGTVGAVTLYNELCLKEVPEMGYNPLGDPPCGEICVRGKTVFNEYYKNPELTKESIKDGWFHTGGSSSFHFLDLSFLFR